MGDENASQSIPNEANVPTVDNSNVIESAPVYTGSVPRETTETPVEDEPTNEVETPPVDDTPEEVQPYQPQYSPEQIQQFAEQAEYQPGEVEINFVDELGNFDPVAFGEFMKQNNQNIFNQALQANQARQNLAQIEGDTWAHVEKSFPEISGNETLSKSLRGARLQDLLMGGDGDLTRLATEIVGPIRQNRIQAIEEANKTITDAQKLETFTPEGATQEAPTLTLMQQLHVAIQSGDSRKAGELRHAIRKERISANN